MLITKLMQFIRAFMVVCIFDKGVKGQCLSFNLAPSFVF